MNWTIKSAKVDKKNVIPEIGQAWKHPKWPDIYIRVKDSVGEKILRDVFCKNVHFASISSSGNVVYTIKDTAEGIELLNMTFSKM